MKNLKEYLFDRECDNIILTEAASIIGEEMINEAFKSKILSKLASTIKEYEKEHHLNDIEKQKDYNDKGWGKINPSEKTFTSLFGPIVQTSRYGFTKKVRGCQWDKITDDNVTYYEGGYDSALHKKIKQLYASKIRGLLIVCDPETHDIQIMMIKQENRKNLQHLNLLHGLQQTVNHIRELIIRLLRFVKVDGKEETLR